MAWWERKVRQHLWNSLSAWMPRLVVISKYSKISSSSSCTFPTTIKN